MSEWTLHKPKNRKCNKKEKHRGREKGKGERKTKKQKRKEKKTEVGSEIRNVEDDVYYTKSTTPTIFMNTLHR